MDWSSLLYQIPAIKPNAEYTRPSPREVCENISFLRQPSIGFRVENLWTQHLFSTPYFYSVSSSFALNRSLRTILNEPVSKLRRCSEPRFKKICNNLWNVCINFSDNVGIIYWLHVTFMWIVWIRFTERSSVSIPY